MKLTRIIPLFGAVWLCLSCAFDLAHVDFTPATLSTCAENCSSLRIAKEHRLSNMPCGYSRTLKADTQWVLIGSIAAGEVYKPLDQCFTVECSNVFEAYLVVNGNTLNGFYLPVEDGYVALKKPVALALK